MGEADKTGGVIIVNGKGSKAVGVSDGAGSGVAARNMVGVSVGSGVLVGRWVRDGRGLAVIEANGTGLPVERTTGVGSAPQAARESTSPTESNAFLIACLAF
ncbi:MAG TPA: hypothetical protein VF784_03310 [Anaerolineales bacterium]